MTRDDVTMSLLEHLEELRSRIIVIAIAVLVLGLPAYFVFSRANRAAPRREGDGPFP